MSNWQPIKTAPPDRGVALVYVAYHKGDAPHIRRGWKHRELWTDLNGQTIYPTHWMPLPAPPEVDAQQPPAGVSVS